MSVNLLSAIQNLQEAHTASEAKIKKTSDFIKNVEQIMLGSEDLVSSLPTSADVLAEEVKAVLETYDNLSEVSSHAEMSLSLKEQEVVSLYEAVLQTLSS